MLDISLDKIAVLGVLAALLLGPERLPGLMAKAARGIATLRRLATETRARAEEELGSEIPLDQWRRLDPRQYDPRRIIRDVLLESTPPAVPVTTPSTSVTAGDARDDH